MIKVEVIREFTFARFDEIKDSIKRRSIDTYGKLYVGDTFECDVDTAKYLIGGNERKDIVVKAIEIIPKKKKK
jgi:hypothetical protein